MPVTLMDGGVI